MNILLSCSGGFSSSLVASKIVEASEKQGKSNKVWAINPCDIEDHIGDADVVLLAPQIIHEKENFQKICGAKGIPFGVISHQDYGYCNGENVLAQAEMLVKEYGGK